MEGGGRLQSWSGLPARYGRAGAIKAAGHWSWLRLPTWYGRAGAALQGYLLGRSAWECQGKVSSASKADDEECQNWQPLASGQLDGGRERKWCLPVLLFSEKVPTDPCPSSTYPKIN